FSIRAQLTDNSWLLYRDIRLTGGFAFVVWWKGPLSGQFVLTLGGYHPSFHRDGYPDVPRLGLIWHISDAICVKGESYFALTSEALMAGVGIELSADFGFVWARIAFGADGIVYFDPFWFEVSAYARISAGIKIETWFGTISFSISLGAMVDVWGPDFSGEATIEVGPCSFTVPFGSGRVVPKRVLTWSEFVPKYLEDGGGAAKALSAITGKGTVPSSTGGKTSAPTADGSAERPFEVFAEFELTVTTTIPTKQFALGLLSGPRNVPVTLPDGGGAELGLAPMKAGSLSSTVTFTLGRQNASGTYDSQADKLRLLGANLEAASPKPEGSSISTDAFPIGAWGPPKPEENKALPTGDVLFAGSSVRLVAEATLVDRGPEMDYYRVDAGRRPLPLSAGGSARPDLLALASTVLGELPTPATAAQALEDAQARLFAPAPAASAGTLPRGARSRLERASYPGTRAAPPLFGTLADGLAPANGADPAADKQGAQVAPAPAAPRPPTVLALLTSGAGVAKRAPRTTVANAKIKRRPAPSLASVEARFAPHLPVRLTVSPLPSTKRTSTVIATGVVPRTDAPGMTRTYRAGQIGGIRGLDGLVGGLPGVGLRGVAAKAGTTASDAATAPPPPPAGPGGSLITAGDVLVMQLPDAH